MWYCFEQLAIGLDITLMAKDISLYMGSTIYFQLYYFTSYNINIMLRFTNLVRSNLKRTQLCRAGTPGWDRPDPPPTVRVPTDHEVSEEELLFYFPDGSMTEFFLTQPQIYEGDTLNQSGPMFLRGMGVFIGFAFSIASAFYALTPLKSNRPTQKAYFEHYTSFITQKVEDKFYLKWGKQNPFGIDVSGDTFPQQYYGNTQRTPAIVATKKTRSIIDESNSQARNYFMKLKQACRQKVKAGHTH